MKAIHNLYLIMSILKITVFNTSNIQNESNSQHASGFSLQIEYCVQYVKYTK